MFVKKLNSFQVKNLLFIKTQLGEFSDVLLKLLFFFFTYLLPVSSWSLLHGAWCYKVYMSIHTCSKPSMSLYVPHLSGVGLMFIACAFLPLKSYHASKW